MKSRFFLICMVMLAAVLTVSNFLTIFTSPIHSVINLFLLVGIVILAVLYGERKEHEKYDYDAENPNALISGSEVAGTVYASYPDATPGLGWIL